MRIVVSLAFVLLAAAAASAAIKSGPQINDPVLPFTSNVVVGPYRGMQHCFVCDAHPDQLGLVFFARQIDKLTAKIVKESLKAANSHFNGNVLSWLVFLGPRGTTAEDALAPRVEVFAEQYAMLNMNITVLGDPDGPPGYRVAPDAALTVVLFRNLKVFLNGAWPTRTWSDSSADEAIQLLERGFQTVQ